MSAVEAGDGAVYDRGYRPYEGPRGGEAAATLALYRASIRRALGIRRSWRQKVAPFVLLGIVTIPAIVNVGIGYVTRDRGVDRIEIITYRDYVGVSSALLLFVAIVAPDVMCPDRRQRAAADVRPAADRARLRRRQGRRDRHDPVRLLVHPPGRAVRRQHARQRQRLDYFTGHLDVLWRSARRRHLSRLLRRRIAVAIASLTSAIVGGVGVLAMALVHPSSPGRSSRRRRRAHTARHHPRLCRCTATSCSSATWTPPARWAG